MSDVTVSYKGSSIATMSASGTKTLLTEGKYCEDDITIDYVKSGGGGSTLIEKNISANGTYNASSDSADGYSKVIVSVPNSYSAGDEGKVVSSGALVSQTAHAEITENGTYNTTTNNSVTVSVSGGGVTVTDGIIVKTRDSSGYPTEVDFYNSDGVIEQYTFGNSRENSDSGWAYGKVTTINLKNNGYAVKQGAFYGNRDLASIDFSKITELSGSSNVNNSAGQHFFRDCKALTEVNAPNLTGAVGLFAFYGDTALTTVTMPKISELCGYQQARGCFGGCSALTTCQFGSIGYPVTAIQEGAFNGVTQTGLTITVYTTGSYVDTLVTNIHTSATGATVIVKASENTTYGGNSYSAGDTIVTSTPT